MRHAPRLTALFAACAIAGLSLAATGSADGNKVSICHGTASEPNPYVLISVDESAVAGHFDGTAPGHGWRNHADVMLADGETECPDEVGPPGGEE